MPELQIYNLDDTDTLVTNLKEGEYVFGRGPLLKCEDRRVSRNHGVLKVQQDSITITSVHQNPCFFQSSDSTTITILPKNDPIHVKDGDKFALLPDKFWFKVRVVNTVLPENHLDSSIMEEASSSKRKTEDEVNSGAKRSKFEKDQNFTFSESSSDSVDFLKLHQSCTENGDVEGNRVNLSNSGDGDASSDSIDFLKLDDCNNDEQLNEEKENNSSYTNNVESCSTKNKSIENGETENVKSTDGNSLQIESDRLQALEDVLSDLLNSNETSEMKSGESSRATVSTNVFQTEMKNESQLQPKKEILSDSEDKKDVIGLLPTSTESGSGEAVPKKEVLSDSEDEKKAIDLLSINVATGSGGGVPKKRISKKKPVENKENATVTKKTEQANETHQTKLKAMLDSSDEDEVVVEGEDITAIQINEVDNPQAESDDKTQSIDTNCATTSGTNDRIHRERCWYGPSCFRKNAQHLRQLSHPGDSDYETDPGDVRPMCVYGGSCYRRNPEHRKEYRHPKANKNDKNATNKKIHVKGKRAPAQKYNESSEDDYDLQDPFIGDSGSEFDADSVSEDTTDSDFSGAAEEETKRLLKESKRFLKKNKKDD